MPRPAAESKATRVLADPDAPAASESVDRLASRIRQLRQEEGNRRWMGVRGKEGPTPRVWGLIRVLPSPASALAKFSLAGTIARQLRFIQRCRIRPAFGNTSPLPEFAHDYLFWPRF